MTDTMTGARNLRVRSSLPVPAPSRPDIPPKNSPPQSLGRSHRAKIGKDAPGSSAIDLMREVLGTARYAPHRHRPRLGHRRLRNGDVDHARRAPDVTTLAWESFGEGWVTDAVKQLQASNPP